MALFPKSLKGFFEEVMCWLVTNVVLIVFKGNKTTGQVPFKLWCLYKGQLELNYWTQLEVSTLSGNQGLERSLHHAIDWFHTAVTWPHFNICIMAQNAPDRVLQTNMDTKPALG